MNENKIMSFFKGNKNKLILPSLLLVGVFFLVFGETIAPNDTDKKQNSVTSSIDAKSYTEELERRVTSLLSSISGVSNVKVLLTLDGGSEYIYAEDGGADNVEHIIITNDDGESPVLIREIFSNVRGIAVVCRGGDDINIKKTVTELLSSAFDIPKAKISVAGGV